VEGWQHGRRNAITDVPGIRVGQFTDRRRATGCTVILCETSTAAAVDARGGAPGTRETEVLGLANLVRRCHAVVFTGGSAFGLGAADGVMQYFGERSIGFPTAHRNVPIVSAAVLYDLGIGDPNAFPTARDGYLAALRATRGIVAEGTVGAATGATVSKLLGSDHMLKGGLGTASLLGPAGTTVAALVAVNAVGTIVDPESGVTVAGPRTEPGQFAHLSAAMNGREALFQAAAAENTTLICVATDARLEPHQLQRIAIHAHDGFARTVVPAHTTGDGDIAFAISMGTAPIADHEALTIGVLAARCVEIAILKAIRLAVGLRGIPSATEWASAPS